MHDGVLSWNISRSRSVGSPSGGSGPCHHDSDDDDDEETSSPSSAPTPPVTDARRRRRTTGTTPKRERRGKSGIVPARITSWVPPSPILWGK